MTTRGKTADQTDDAVAPTDVAGGEVVENSGAHRYRVIVWRPELTGHVLEITEEFGAAGVEDSAGGIIALTLSLPFREFLDR